MRRRHTTKRRRSPGQVRCRHRLQHETDWLGRTYVGCPVCGRWKPVKTRVAEPDGRRLAA